MIHQNDRIFILHVAAHLVSMAIFLNPKFSSGAVCGISNGEVMSNSWVIMYFHLTKFDLLHTCKTISVTKNGLCFMMPISCLKHILLLFVFLEMEHPRQVIDLKFLLFNSVWNCNSITGPDVPDTD